MLNESREDIAERLEAARRQRRAEKAVPGARVRLNVYGLTPQRFVTLARIQHGLCAICQEWLELRVPQKAVVDHDHVTGKVRGLLCSRCNTGLGLFGDCPERLTVAAFYLARPRVITNLDATLETLYEVA